MSTGKFSRIITPPGGLTLAGGGINNPVNYLHFQAASSQQSIPVGQTAPFYWTTAPDIQAGFGEYNANQWSNSASSWTPGRVGLYLVVWTLHSGNSACESFIVRNASTVTNGSVPYSTSAMIALTYGLENVATALFYSSSTSDYISFGNYNGASGSVTPNVQRNYLAITRLA